MTRSVRDFRPEDEDGVRIVMEAAFPVDRIPGYVHADIERALQNIVPDPDGSVVALEDDTIVGYCTPALDDLTVHPDRRRRGHGRRLIGAAHEVQRRSGHDELALYVPNHLPESVAFATAMGARYRSSLWQFLLGDDRTVPPPDFPEWAVVRPWDPSVDTDLDAWVSFLEASFEGHPGQPRWSASVIAHMHGAPDFDPTEILLVAQNDDPSQVVAFARIAMIPDVGPAPTGEVRLIGVLPDQRGRGLGRELLRWSVTQLHSRGAGPIELKVEAANERAVSLYRAHGFEPAVEWPHWVFPVS